MSDPATNLASMTRLDFALGPGGRTCARRGPASCAFVSADVITGQEAAAYERALAVAPGELSRVDDVRRAAQRVAVVTLRCHTWRALQPCYLRCTDRTAHIAAGSLSQRRARAPETTAIDTQSHSAKLSTLPRRTVAAKQAAYWHVRARSGHTAASRVWALRDRQ
jgi:hypothetical protein